jgi:signal recognition particle subunit SEC65
MAIRPRVKNLYYLKLVEPKHELKNASEFKRQNMQQWLNDLPAANMGMLTRQLNDKLEHINNTHIDLQQQFEALEALQPVYSTIEAFLNSKICGQALPLPDKAQKIVALQIKISQEYATAYWYLVKNGHKKLSNRAYHKLLPTLLQRLIRLLSNILITHYLVHLSEPTWIWMDIHSLFNVLPDKICENTKINEYRFSGEVSTTIADTYKQIIALSSTDPYGMYDREILRVNHYLFEWASVIKLEQIASGQIPLGYFVSMDNDQAPSWADIDSDLDEDSVVYQIFMDDMIKLAHKKAKLMKTNLGRYFAATAFPVTDNCFDPDLLKHMFRQWDGTPPRQPVKFDNVLHQDVAIGLHAICKGLLNTDNQEAGPVFRAEVASGKSLICTLDSGNQVAIGSLVGFRKCDADNQKFGLGLVSRMLMPRSDSVTRFELKNITNAIQSVNIELHVNDKKKPNKQQADKDQSQEIKAAALIYRKQDKNADRHYLIVESRVFKENDTIIMNEENCSYSALLLKQKNLGLGYVVIEYQPDEVEEEKEPIPATGYDFL